jgi:hypothetical protein
VWGGEEGCFTASVPFRDSLTETDLKSFYLTTLPNNLEAYNFYNLHTKKETQKYL